MSRGDLIKSLAAAPIMAAAISDDELSRDMRARLDHEPWVSNRGINFTVKNGVISLWGQVASTTERSAIEILAKTAAGCRGVDNQLNVVAGMPYDDQLRRPFDDSQEY